MDNNQEQFTSRSGGRRTRTPRYERILEELCSSFTSRWDKLQARFDSATQCKCGQEKRRQHSGDQGRSEEDSGHEQTGDSDGSGDGTTNIDLTQEHDRNQLLDDLEAQLAESRAILHGVEMENLNIGTTIPDSDEQQYTGRCEN